MTITGFISVAQWLERPAAVREVMCSNPIDDSDFSCPTLVAKFITTLVISRVTNTSLILASRLKTLRMKMLCDRITAILKTFLFIEDTVGNL